MDVGYISTAKVSNDLVFDALEHFLNKYSQSNYKINVEVQHLDNSVTSYNVLNTMRYRIPDDNPDYIMPQEEVDKIFNERYFE